MTNETNAALSALKDAYEVLDTGGARHVIGVDKAMKLVKRFGEAIALLEASQREAPVAEGVSARQRGMVEIILQDLAGKDINLNRAEHLAVRLWDSGYGRRLADRPSVTNVSREAIRKTYYLAHSNKHAELTAKPFFPGEIRDLKPATEAGLDAIFALQLQLPTPSAEQGALISTSPVTEQIVAIASLPNILAKYIPNAEDLHHATQDVLAALQLPAPGKAADEGVTE